MDSIAGPSSHLDNLVKSEVESDPENDISCTPEEIVQQAKQITESLLPDKSKERYNIQYQLFMDWCLAKNIKEYGESVLLTYISELSQKFTPSTLYTINSMLKATLLVNNNIDVGSYKKVTAFLKKQSVGYIAKKSRTFTQQQINQFLTEAPNETYLMMKVVLIIGISGACRSQELTNMTIDNVVDTNDILTIHTKNINNNKQRTFTISNSEEEDSINVMSLYRKYLSLRPKNMNSQRLFVKYAAGKCIRQNVGFHTISGIPSKIATYLNLSNCKKFTGHCYRRTAATLLADSGDLQSVQLHSGCDSSNVAEDHGSSIENKIESVENKISVAKETLSTNNDVERSTKCTEQKPFSEGNQLSNFSKHGIIFSNCTFNNSVLNINF